MSNETEQKDCLHCIKVFFFFLNIKKTGECIYFMQPQHVEHIYYMICYQVLKAQLSLIK